MSTNLSSTENKFQKPIEIIGIIPRSIIRTLDRFRLQLFPSSYPLMLKEYKISRYQILVSVQCFLCLVFIPLSVTFLVKTFIFCPITEYFWNNQNHSLFLNTYLEKEALTELQDFEEQLYFEYLVAPPISETFSEVSTPKIEKGPFFLNPVNPFPDILKTKIQKKNLEIALSYNQKSIDALINILSDFLYFGTVIGVIRVLEVRMIIFKSILVEFIFNLSDTHKSVLLILLTDLLVGFHSSRIWEFFLEFLLNRFGFSHDEILVYFGVATLPVLLDTAFKYWVFRYLNRIAPSTVATYHTMIE